MYCQGGFDIFSCALNLIPPTLKQSKKWSFGSFSQRILESFCHSPQIEISFWMFRLKTDWLLIKEFYSFGYCLNCLMIVLQLALQKNASKLLQIINSESTYWWYWWKWPWELWGADDMDIRGSRGLMRVMMDARDQLYLALADVKVLSLQSMFSCLIQKFFSCKWTLPNLDSSGQNNP